MKVRKILALVLAFAMILSTISFSVYAEEYVAMVGNEGFTSLADAVAFAGEGSVVTVLEGNHVFADGEKIVIDKAITLSGAGKDVTTLTFNTPNASAITIEADNVTIENLSISQISTNESTHISISKGAWDAPEVKYSDITFEDVSFLNGKYALCVIGEDITISECDFNNQSSHSILVYSVRGDSKIINNNFGKATGSNKYAINFEGGVSTNLTDEQLDAFEANGTLTISGNTATEKGVFFIFNNWGLAENLTLNISNNIVDAFTNKAIVFYEGGISAETGNEFSEININENVFVNVPDGRAVVRDERVVSTLAIDATGNYWGSADPDFDVVADEGNVITIPYYTDKAKTEIETGAAQIGDIQYPSVQAAIDSAADGETIVILKNIQLTSQDAKPVLKPAYNRESYAGLIIPDDKEVVIDLNGKTLSYVDEYYEIDNCMIINLGDLTINDSVGGGKITYKPVPGSSTYSKFYSTIFNCGKLTVNGGIIENTADDDTDVTDAVDNHSRLSHEYGNDCILIVNGGVLRGSEYYAVRQYTHYLEGVQNRVIINDGIIDGGIYMQHGDSWYYADPSSNRLNVDCQLEVNGGEFTDNGSGIPSIKSRLSNPDNNSWKVDINGGSFEGSVNLLVQKGYYYINGVSGAMTSEPVGASNEAWLAKNGGFISGGIFAVAGESGNNQNDITMFLEDGFAAVPTSDGGLGIVDEELAVDEIFVTFTEATTTEESEKLYNINLTAAGKIINRLNSADLTFALKQYEGKNMYEIVDIADDYITFNPVYDAEDGSIIDGRYEFHFEHKDNITNDTAATITIAQVKFSGYGKFDFYVAQADANAVHATTNFDNIVDTFVPNGSLTGGKDLIIDTGITDEEIIVPKRDLTINVLYPNGINENVYAYQQMSITITGPDNYERVIYLGNGDSVKENGDCLSLVAGGYSVKLKDELTLNSAYTVALEGAGYRTVKYTVNMTEAKTLNFWNNVKDNEAYVEVSESGIKKYAQKVTFLAGDIVKDNEINVYDLSAVVSYFGEIDLDKDYKPEYAKYDLNRDGKIDSKDVAYVLVSWGN